MKLLAVAVAAVATLSSTAQAQFARVINNCPFPVYLQSFPYSGGQGNLVHLPQHGLYAEPFHPDGSTIKLGTQHALAHPLFFGYSLVPNLGKYSSSSASLSLPSCRRLAVLQPSECTS